MRVFFVGALVLVLGALVSWGVFFTLSQLFPAETIPVSEEPIIEPFAPTEEAPVVEYVPNSYQVGFQDGVSLETAQTIVEANGAEIMSEGGLMRVILHIRASEVQAEAIKKDLGVLFVEQDTYLEVSSVDTESSLAFVGTSIGFPSLGLQKVHAAEQVDLIIVDSGERDGAGRTHIGLVTAAAQETLGALGVSDVSVSSIDITRGEGPITTAGMRTGIETALRAEADIINLSIVTPIDLQVFEDAFSYASANNIPIINSVGNSTAQRTHWQGHPAVITTGGMRSYDPGTGVPTWCVHSSEFYGGTPGTSADFYAFGEMSGASGTSFSAPRLAAHAAALIAEHGAQSKASLVALLQSNQEATPDTPDALAYASRAKLFSEGNRVPTQSAYLTCVPEGSLISDVSTDIQTPASGDTSTDQSAVTPSVASACPQNFNLLPDDACTLEGFFAILLDAVVNIGAILLVLALVWTGFLFVQAQGNEEKIRNARSALMWAVLGGLLLLGAQALSMVIKATIETL